MTIAAFAEDQFPPNISAGAKGGPMFNTSVTKLSSGFEQRNVNWSRELMTWDISTGIKTIHDFVAYQKFFYARMGKAQGFRFKDWSDYRAPFWDQTPGDIDPIPTTFTTDGTTATVQLVKNYTSGGVTFSRKITKPVTGSIQMVVNGSTSTDFTVNTTTGVITLGAGTHGTTGATVGFAFEFDVPVRFDTDSLNAGCDGNQLFIWDSIPVVGLKI